MQAEVCWVTGAGSAQGHKYTGCKLEYIGSQVHRIQTFDTGAGYKLECTEIAEAGYSALGVPLYRQGSLEAVGLQERGEKVESLYVQRCRECWSSG